MWQRVHAACEHDEESEESVSSNSPSEETTLMATNSEAPLSSSSSSVKHRKASYRRKDKKDKASKSLDHLEKKTGTGSATSGQNPKKLLRNISDPLSGSSSSPNYGSPNRSTAMSSDASSAELPDHDQPR